MIAFDQKRCRPFPELIDDTRATSLFSVSQCKFCRLSLLTNRCSFLPNTLSSLKTFGFGIRHVLRKMILSHLPENHKGQKFGSVRSYYHGFRNWLRKTMRFTPLNWMEGELFILADLQGGMPVVCQASHLIRIFVTSLKWSIDVSGVGIGFSVIFNISTDWKRIDQAHHGKQTTHLQNHVEQLSKITLGCQL